MVRKSSVALRGLTNKEYVFYVYDMDQIPEDTGGIYAVTKRFEDSEGVQSHDVLYIGESPNVLTEFEKHPKADCFAQHDANSVCICSDDDEDSREAIESDLKEYYKLTLKCNDVIP
jgi:hypothetical protein